MQRLLTTLDNLSAIRRRFSFFMPSMCHLCCLFFTYKLTHSPILPDSAEDTACDASTAKCIGLEQTHSPCPLGDHFITAFYFNSRWKILFVNSKRLCIFAVWKIRFRFDKEARGLLDGEK